MVTEIVRVLNCEQNPTRVTRTFNEQLLIGLNRDQRNSHVGYPSKDAHTEVLKRSELRCNCSQSACTIQYILLHF